jgi:hypothetical protein
MSNNQITIAGVSNPTIATGINNPALIAKELKAQVNVIQDVMRSVMKNGEHYGTIPGCGDKKVLLKSGAEKLLMAFRLGAEPIIETNETSDSVSYRIRVRVFNISDNNTVGYGIGECSSLEEKYLWRKAIGAEYKNTQEDRRRIKYAYKGEIEQVRVNHRDVSNTVLKMAKKRALVDAVLTCTAASDIFTQDLEDWDESMIETIAEDKIGNGLSRKPSVASANNPAPIAPEVTAAPMSALKSSLKQLGLEAEIKDDFIAARGNLHGKDVALKSLGFQYYASKKVWCRKAA